jgi:hypothetical protein
VARDPGTEAVRRERRRIDLGGERADALERLLELRLELLEKLRRRRRIALDDLSRELHRDRRCGEVLLDAVVERLLDPPPLAVELGEEGCQHPSQFACRHGFPSPNGALASP